MATTITRETKINIGLAAAIFAGGIAAAVQLALMREDIQQLKEEQFTMAQASETALRLAIENPQLRVPDPRNLPQVIQVRSGP